MNSQGGKSDGFLFYAPRRAREAPISDREPATAPMPQEPQSASVREPESDMLEPDDDRTEPSDGQDSSKEAEPARVEDPLEHAIRDLIALGPGSSDGATEDASAPVVEEHDEVSRSLPVAVPPRYGRQDRSEVQTRRPRRGYQISRRLSSLEPEIVPQPRGETPQNGAVAPLMRFSLVIMFAAVVAYGVTKLSSLQLGDGWIQGASDRVGGIASGSRAPPVEQAPPVEPPSRLVVGDQQALANEPLPLAVVVEHPRPSEVVQLAGLSAGTRLSAGTSTGASTWRLSPGELTGLRVYAPKDFVGVMNAAVDLIGADKRRLDSRVAKLDWIPKPTDPAKAPAAPAPAAFAAAPAPAPAPAAVLPLPKAQATATVLAPLAPPPAPAKAANTVLATTGDRIGVGAPRPAAVDPIDSGEVDFLMRQGQQAMTGGDISAARVAFRRLADAGNAAAALALAETYDPSYLAEQGVIGLSGDRATAKQLYERARALGATEADGMLARLAEH
jgi:hypothetical protein